MDIQTIEKILKDVYLGIISDVLNKCNDLFISKIEKTGIDVWGKKIITPIMLENGEYINAEEDLETFCEDIEISDKSIRCCQNMNQLINLLNDLIENLLYKKICYKLTNAIFSKDTPNRWLTEKEIKSYKPFKICGFEEIFSNSEYLYGIKREQYKELNPIQKTIKEFNRLSVQEIIDNYNDEVDMIICNRKTKRLYEEYLLNNHICVEFIEIDDRKYLSFNNIPIVIEDVEDDVIYLINSKDFKFHQLCDWLWLENDYNKILNQCANYPIYKAYIVKYGNLICKAPYKQIKINIKK